MDVARLGFEVPTDGIEKGVAALNKLTPAAKQAETAAAGVSNAATRANTSIRDAASGVGAFNSAIGKMAAGSASSGVGRLAEGYDLLTGKIDKNFLAIGKNMQAWNRVPKALGAIPPAANAAGAALDRLGKHASDNINKMQSTPGNIAAQFQDIGVTAAGGMSPMLIALQQGTQLSAAFANGFKDIGPAIRQILSPVALLTIGLVGLAAAGIQMVNWPKLAAAALNGLADVLVDIAPYAVAAAAGLMLINAPAIISGVIGLTKAMYGLAAGILATVGIPALLVLGLVAVVAAAVHFRDELTDIFGVDIVKAAQDGVNMIIGAYVGAYNGIKAAWSMLPAAMGDLTIQAANATLAAIDGMVNGAISRINGLTAQLPFGLGDDLKLGDIKFGRQDNPYAGAAAEVGQVVKEAVRAGIAVDYVGKGIKGIQAGAKSLAGTMRGWASGLLEGDKKKGGGKTKGATGGKSDAEKIVDVFAGAQADIATEKARELSVAVGLNIDTAAALVQETKLLNQIQQKGIPITDAVRQKVKELAAEYGKAKLAADTAEAFGKSILASDQEKKSLFEQRELIGKYGEELMLLKKRQELISKPQVNGITFDDKQVAELEKRAKSLASGEYSNLMKQVDEDRTKSHKEQMRQLSVEQAALGLTGEALVAYQYEQKAITDAKARGIEVADLNIAKIREEAAAYAQVRTEIDHTASRMAAMNGLVSKSPLGKGLGALMSDDPTTALLGMGGLGSLAGLFTKGGRDTSAKQAEQIASKISDVFGINGPFAKTLADAVQGAGTGAAVGSTLFSKSQAGQLGSTIGGALGQVAGKKLLSSLGSFAGPVGSIVGSIAGGVLGKKLEKLFNPNRTANAIVTGSGITVGGKDTKQYGAAGDLGSGLSDTLKGFADRLGATLGDFKISIGTRGDEIRVNGGGTSLKTKNGAMGFGEDQEAALMYAVEQAISQGAFTGLSEGINRYLTEGAGDLEKRFSDIMTLQGARDELSQARDPEAFALGQLDKEFDNLRKIATAVGEGLADVEELYGIRRKEIAEKYAAEVSEAESAALDLSRQRREMEIELMRLNGDEIGALAAARQMERAELDPTLHGLYDLITARQDEISAANEQTRLTESMADLERRLAEARGDDALVKQMERTRELNGAVTETERALLQQIHTTTDLTEAARAAADEQKRLSDSMSSLSERLASAQGNDVLARQIARQRELGEAVTETERDMLRQIYAAEDYNSALTQQTNLFTSITKAARETSNGLRELADSLFGKDTIGDSDAMRKRVMGTLEMAARGDQDAIAALPGMINDYLPTAKRTSATASGYDAEVAFLQESLRGVADLNESNAQLSATLTHGWMNGNMNPDTRYINEKIAAQMASLEATMTYGNSELLESQKTLIRQGNAADRRAAQLSDGGYAQKVYVVGTASND